MLDRHDKHAQQANKWYEYFVIIGACDIYERSIHTQASNRYTCHTIDMTFMHEQTIALSAIH